MLSNKDVSFLNMARYFAEKSEENKRHGAIVVKSVTVERIHKISLNKLTNTK